ncbi:hypothetical protein, partial [Shewanella xiamenensis]|uniref:hypothetical protein n=1 Tax=Shewanella xiamenensis TaxID=332186 RepID=UPI0035BB110C
FCIRFALSPRSLSLSAVSVDAHYRQRNFLCKRFLKEKRSHGDLFYNGALFTLYMLFNSAF